MTQSLHTWRPRRGTPAGRVVDTPGRHGFPGRGRRGLPGPSAKRRSGRWRSRHSTRFSRFSGTVQQGPVQPQETQIVQSCKTLDDFLPGFRPPAIRRRDVEHRGLARGGSAPLGPPGLPRLRRRGGGRRPQNLVPIRAPGRPALVGEAAIGHRGEPVARDLARIGAGPLGVSQRFHPRPVTRSWRAGYGLPTASKGSLVTDDPWPRSTRPRRCLDGWKSGMARGSTGSPVRGLRNADARPTTSLA